MARNPDAISMPPKAMSAPQAASPSMPTGAVAILYDWPPLYDICWIALLSTRRWPLDPGFSVGCGADLESTTETENLAYAGHKGIDLYRTAGDTYVARACPAGGTGITGGNVYPAFAGCVHQATPNKAKVIYSADAGGSGIYRIGNCIILEHLDETHRTQFRTTYMHLATRLVNVGDWVDTSTIIGTIGTTNNFSHLHFEVNTRTSDHPEWRTAEERALLVASIQTYRPYIDPETMLPSLAEASGDLISIAGMPPPAQSPPPGLSHFFPQWPLFPAYSAATYGVVEGSHGGWPAWLAAAYRTAAGVSTVYPFLDSPTGRLWVAGTAVNTPGIDYEVWLLHTDANYNRMVITWYRLYAVSGAALAVAQGDWIDVGTPLGTITRVAGTTMLEWGVFARDAPWTEANPPFEPTYNPNDVYFADSVHPACFLFAEPGWLSWPPAAYRALPAPCLGAGLGGV